MGTFFRPLRQVSCFTAAVLVSVISVKAQSGPMSGEAIFARVSDSVFLLNLTDAAGASVGSATGFLVAPDAVLTNAHVANKGRIVIRLGSVDLPCSVERMDLVNDLALCKMPGRSAATPIPLASEGPRPGAVVFAVGNPRGLEKTITQGLFTGLRELDGQQVAQISASISPGSSGGPILNAAGELVGVAVSSLKDGQSLNFAVPLEITRAFVLNKSTATNTVESLLASVQQLSLNRLAYSRDLDSDYQKQQSQVRDLLAEAVRLAQKQEELERIYKAATFSRAAIQVMAARRIVAISKKPTREMYRMLAEALWFTENERGPLEALVEGESAAAKAVELGGGKIAADLILLGNIQAQEEKVVQAIANFERAVALATDPAERHEATYAAFQAAYGSGRDAQADTWASKLDTRELYPYQIDDYAKYLEARQRLRESGNAYLIASEKLPKSSTYQCSAGRAFWLANALDESLAANRKCIELATIETDSKESIAFAHRSIAAILNQRGVFDQAESHAKQSIQIAPTDPWAYDALAEAQIGQNRYTEGVVSARAAIRHSDGKFGTMHFTLGSALFELKQYNEAAKSYEKAAELSPNDASAAYNVAVSYLNVRFNADALRWYRETLRRNPQHPQREDINREILRLSK